MCQQGGEFLGEKWSNKGETCLIFEKLVAHRALRVHHFGRVALVRGKGFAWGVSALFWLLIFPHFPSASCMTASSFISVFEESCFGFWSIASSRCPCLRESIFAWVSDCSCTSELFVTCLSSSLFASILSLLWLQVVCWQCTHQGGDWGMSSTHS